MFEKSTLMTILSFYFICADREDADPVTRREPKKRIPLTSRLRVLNIKQKKYGKMGVLFNFMLEEVQDYGPANLGKFAR